MLAFEPNTARYLKLIGFGDITAESVGIIPYENQDIKIILKTENQNIQKSVMHFHGYTLFNLFQLAKIYVPFSMVDAYKNYFIQEEMFWYAGIVTGF